MESIRTLQEDEIRQRIPLQTFMPHKVEVPRNLERRLLEACEISFLALKCQSSA